MCCYCQCVVTVVRIQSQCLISLSFVGSRVWELQRNWITRHSLSDADYKYRENISLSRDIFNSPAQMVSGFRSHCQYFGPRCQDMKSALRKINFISLHFDNKWRVYPSLFRVISTLLNFPSHVTLQRVLSGEMSWESECIESLEWLCDPIWSHIRVLVTLWPFMPILMWFVVIPEPAPSAIHLCYSDLIKTRSHPSPSPSVTLRHLDFLIPRASLSP